MWINGAEAAGIPGVDDDGNGFIDDYGGWDFVVRPTSGFAAPGEDARDEANDPYNWGGHGTTIAGIIGAIPGNGIGLAGVVPQVRLMPLRIGWLQSGGPPPSGGVDMSSAAEGIRAAPRHGAPSAEEEPRAPYGGGRAQTLARVDSLQLSGPHAPGPFRLRPARRLSLFRG